MNGAESLIRTLVAGALRPVSPTQALQKYTSSRRWTGSAKRVAFLACLRASSPERPTATPEWRRNRRALCFISARA